MKYNKSSELCDAPLSNTNKIEAIFVNKTEMNQNDTNYENCLKFCSNLKEYL